MSVDVIYKTSATATGGRDGAARSDDRVKLIDEEDYLALSALHFIKNGLQSLLEFAAELGSGDQRSHVERHHSMVLE